jgi:hypothetical protein
MCTSPLAEYSSVSSANDEASHNAFSSVSVVTSSLLGPDIFLSTVSPYTLSLWSSLSVGDEISHPHLGTGQTVVYIVILVSNTLANG